MDYFQQFQRLKLKENYDKLQQATVLQSYFQAQANSSKFRTFLYVQRFLGKRLKFSFKRKTKSQKKKIFI